MNPLLPKKTFKVTFKAVRLNKPGKIVHDTMTVTSTNEMTAIISLYDQFQHVEVINIQEIPNEA